MYYNYFKDRKCIMIVKTVDGNEACARSAYIVSDIAGIYPITPS